MGNRRGAAGCILFLCAWLPASLFPGEMDLEALLETAARDNRSVRAARFEAEASRGRLREARSARFPELVLNLAAGGQLNPPDAVEVAAGEFGILPPPLSTPLPDGDTLIIAGGDYPLYRLELKGSVPLCTSGEIDAAVQRAGTGIEAARLRYRIALRDAEAEVKSALYSLAVIRGLREEGERQRKLAGQLVETGRRNLENGLILKPALMELEAAERESELFLSELERREGEQLRRLRRAAGDPGIETEELTLPGTADARELFGGLPAPEELVRSALENNPELQLLRLGELDAAARRDSAAADLPLRPRIGLEVAFAYEGTRLPFLEEGWDDAGKSRWNLTALAGVELPLFDGGGGRGVLEREASLLSASRVRTIEGEEAAASETETLYGRALYLDRRLEYLSRRVLADAASVEQLERQVRVGSADERDLILRRMGAVRTRMDRLSASGELYLVLFALEALTGSPAAVPRESP